MLKEITKLMFALATAGAITVSVASPQPVSAATAVLFTVDGLGSASTLTPSVISNIQSSGFTTLVLFNWSIDSSGNFWYAGQEICANGNYVGPSNWGSLLGQCLGGGYGMYRIEACFGGWGDQSFANIENIMAAQGYNTGNVLYRNLTALKNALPISAICFDDESTYDANSAIEFGTFAGDQGLYITLCPYTNSGYWQQVASGLSQFCDYVYLQTYSGGAGNDPAQWASWLGGSTTADHGPVVMPLYWDWDRNSTFQTYMQNWGKEGCVGGGLYLSCYNCNPSGVIGELPTYSGWIHSSLDFQYNGANVVIVNRNTLQVVNCWGDGTDNGTPLAQYPLETGGMSGSEQNEIFQMYNNNGVVYFLERLSGRAIEVPGYSYTVGQTLDIHDWAGIPNQEFQVYPIDSGFYVLAFRHDQQAMQVQWNSTSPGAPLVQYTLWANGYNAEWMLRAPEVANP